VSIAFEECLQAWETMIKQPFFIFSEENPFNTLRRTGEKPTILLKNSLLEKLAFETKSQIEPFRTPLMARLSSTHGKDRHFCIEPSEVYDLQVKYFQTLSGLFIGKIDQLGDSARVRASQACRVTQVECAPQSPSF
jgi:hypothetical protein